MTWAATMLALVAASAAIEFALVGWSRAITDDHPRVWRAAGLSFSIRVATSCTALVWIDDHRAILAAAAGDALGTVLGGRFFAHRNITSYG